MCDKNLRYPCHFEEAFLNLDLGPFAAVKEPDVAVLELKGGTGNASGWRWEARGCPDKCEFHVYMTLFLRSCQLSVGIKNRIVIFYFDKQLVIHFISISRNVTIITHFIRFFFLTKLS